MSLCQLDSDCPLAELIMAEVQASRKLALSVLSDALMGDQLAAEFTLLHLLSSVYVTNSNS